MVSTLGRNRFALLPRLFVSPPSVGFASSLPCGEFRWLVASGRHFDRRRGAPGRCATTPRRMGASGKVSPLGLLVIFLATAAAAPSDAIYPELQVFARAISAIEEEWLGSVDDKRLIAGAIGGMAQTLDANSVYLSPPMYRALIDGDVGGLCGIGVVFEKNGAALRVRNVLPGGPADAAGVRVGDAVVAIEQRGAENFSPALADTLVHGRAGAAVAITLTREGFVVPRVFTITRQALPTFPVTSTLYGDILYLHLHYFPNASAGAVAQALRQKHRAIIFDLRDDPGGVVAEAAKIAELFVRTGTVVSTVGRQAKVLASYEAHNPAPDRSPMIVLVNGGTASAAEIVAAALQDLHRARLLGTRTFGKGSVQSIIEFDDGSALKLTTAHYLTAGKRDIDGKGLVPDLVVESDASAVNDTQLAAALASFNTK